MEDWNAYQRPEVDWPAKNAATPSAASGGSNIWLWVVVVVVAVCTGCFAIIALAVLGFVFWARFTRPAPAPPFRPPTHFQERNSQHLEEMRKRHEEMFEQMRRDAEQRNKEMQDRMKHLREMPHEPYLPPERRLVK